MTAFARVLLTCAWLAAALLAQTMPKPIAVRPSPLAAEFLRLEQRLDAGPRLPLRERTRLLSEFLTRHQATPMASEVLAVLLRRGGARLQQLDATGARADFHAVLEHAAPADHELRNRTWFGLHQVQLQLGDRDAARQALGNIDLDAAAPTAAAAVRLAIEQLDHAEAVQVGKALPRLTYGVDTNNHLVTAEQFQPGPRLLVFWSLGHAPSQRRLEALATAWTQCGLPMTNLIAFANDDDLAALQRMIRERGWTFSVLPTQGDCYLHPDWQRLQVTAVPTMLLVAADHKLVARDLPPDRLAELLGHR